MRRLNSILLIFILGCAILACKHTVVRYVPYYVLDDNGNWVESETPDNALRVPPFNVTNQSDKPVNLSTLQHEVWVAAFYNAAAGFNSHAQKEIQHLLFTYRDVPELNVCNFGIGEISTSQDLGALDSIPGIGNLELKGSCQFLKGSDFPFEFLISDEHLDPESNSSLALLIDRNSYVRGIYNLADSADGKRLREALPIIVKAKRRDENK